MRLRAIWLSIHKWIGILLAILIIPISVTGSALVWDHWLDAQINPQRYTVSTSEPRLTPSAYAAAARPAIAAAAQGGQIAQIRYPEEGEGSVIVSGTRPQRAGGGRPPRTNVWVDPGTGAVLDSASSAAGLVMVFHQLHGNLLVPGVGRGIVGWVGLFMLLSCLTGLWLWWPVTGSLRRGFRWKRQNSTNANIHHQLGFWIAIPLAMLSFTGVWIAFPAMFGAGGGPPAGGRQGPPQPLAVTRLAPEAALAAAQPLANGARLTSITWPTDKAPEWKIGYERQGEISVADATGQASAPRGPGPGQQRPLMRRLHDGTGMGLVWQIVIFIGGIIPAILAITGLVMWWRSRGWKKMLAKKRKAKALTPQPAE
jgi:uncharacterized iron-regulated membrane protein